MNRIIAYFSASFICFLFLCLLVGCDQATAPSLPSDDGPIGATPTLPGDGDPATIIYVNQAVIGGNDDGSSWANAYGDIIKAVASAEGESQVWVAQGTYLLTSQLELKNSVAIYGGFLGDESTLGGRNFTLNVTTIDAKEVNSNGKSAVTTTESIEENAVLDGFTITNSSNASNSPDNGGGLSNGGGSPTLTNLIFLNNNANNNGGGMYSDGGQPTLTNVVFTNNTATNGGGFYNNAGNSQLSQVSFGNDTVQGNEVYCGNGGGMYIAGGSPNITNSFFSTNQISDDDCATLNPATLENAASLLGSGLYVASGSPTLTDVSFSTNTGSSGGGGLYNAAGTVTINGGSFQGNTVETGANGAGIYNDSGKLALSGTVFNSNASPINGGGLYNASGSVTITGASFAFNNNSASQDGGAILNDSGQLTIAGGSFTNNHAGGNGGGLANNSGTITFSNNTNFTQNSAGGNGGGIYNTSSNLTLTPVLFKENAAGNDGGGLYSSGEQDYTLSGLKFESNQAANGGGLYVTGDGSLTAEDIQFSGNQASNGGGLYSQDVAVSASDLTFQNNTAQSGGGAYINFATSKVWSGRIMSFSQNQTGSGSPDSGGAGLYITVENTAPSILLDRVMFDENQAEGRGGGLSLRCAYKFPFPTPLPTVLTMSNTRFTGNNAWFGGALYNNFCQTASTNITVVGNSMTNTGYGNFMTDFYGANNVSNSIFWGNTGPGSDNAFNYQVGAFFQACGALIIQNSPTPSSENFATCFVKPAPLTVSSLDPELDAAYELTSGSPAINTGDNDYVPEGEQTDLAGNKRVVGCAVDIGAYENQSATSCQAPTSAPNYDSQAWICDIGTNGKWVSGYQVRYAVSFVTSYGESSRGPWSDWIAGGQYARPTLMEIPTDPTGRATSRNVYRQFLIDYSSSDPDNGVLQIGTLNDNATTRMADPDDAGTTDLGGC